MTTTLQVTELDINGYKLSVTTRDAGDDPIVLGELTKRTIGTWLFIVENGLTKQVYTLNADSVEQRYIEEQNEGLANDDPNFFALPEKWGDPRVTVWDIYRGQNQINFHLNSDDVPQVAIDTWLAQQKGVARALAEYGKIEPQATATRSAPPTGTTAPNAPAAPQQRVVVATQAPSPSKLQYADGQLVQYTINKIVIGTNKGSVTYALWGPLGTKYPIVTIYKTKSGSDENSPNYIACAEALIALGLSVDANKLEAQGKWGLVCRASIFNDKMYMNAMSLIAV